MADVARSEDRVITNGIPSQLPDVHPQETQEWLDSLDAVVEHEGRARARYILLRILERARERQVGVPALRSTDYINTIPPENEPVFPGDEHIERRIRAFIRWNAAVMVSRANRPEIGVGGHIATYASAASLYEVGFNHFFRGKGGNGAAGKGGNGAAGKGAPDQPQAGDQVYIQGHAVPGIYARAYLEGRLTEAQLDGFRQESKPGLPSYPHPRLMPDFWEFPTVSMGLGALNAVYQARFNRYLQHRGIADTSESRVWCFLGDGEMDEPESVAPIGVAGREQLDNLVFVVNCNLQRLDGPVRGNGKIIQELESLFRGAGWNVIKVVWGRDWDDLLARDTDGVLVNKMNATPDGQFQTYSVESGDYIREHFFGDDPRLRKIVEHLSDEDLTRLSRGGHDYRKVYAAFDAAVRHTGEPTVILAQTIKGWTIEDFEARNAAHQMKKLTDKALKKFRDRLYLDISDEQLERGLPPFYHPGEDSEEISYLHERRRALGGYLPRRVVRGRGVDLPDSDAYAELKRGSGDHEVATTMAFVRQLRELLKHDDLGQRIVPIVPDEARTFGMDSLFPQQKIYSPFGQTYDPVDRHMLLSYQEAVDGQVIHEGITEAGSMGTVHAAGSSYATFNEPMLPVYVFYSMFGFQRTGDLMWSAADQRVRGFLIGATAGRTTLNGEGLQHEDGHSPLLAASNPAVVAYDPSFAYEIAVIMEDGINRMLGREAQAAAGMSADAAGGEAGERGRSPDVMYYLTVYNEPVLQPPMPDGLDESAVVAGLYRYLAAEEDRTHRVQLLASGSGMPLALRARALLADEWDVAADVWSAPAWAELQREALACEEWNQLHPGEEPRVPYVTRALQDTEGPVVAVTDWMKAVPGLIARWVPRQYAVLGTDGFGRSDTREALRRQFRIDAESIVVATLHELAAAGEVKSDTVAEAVDRYGIDPDASIALD